MLSRESSTFLRISTSLARCCLLIWYKALYLLAFFIWLGLCFIIIIHIILFKQSNNKFELSNYQLKYGFILKLYMFSSSIDTFTYYSDYMGLYAIGFSLIFLNSNPKSVNDSSNTSSISGFFTSNLSFLMFSFSVDYILFKI